jgi:regulator of replication initiation timing
MPWEETDQYIRSGHRSPSEFQEGSLRTIMLSEAQGIKAIIGRPKGKDTTAVQSYLFAKEKGWTMAKAKEWFSKHNVAAALRYCVKAQALEKDGTKYALVEVIDENTSRPCEQPPATRVRINPAGKARALADLLEKPLRGPPELGHDATEIVGRPVDFTSNHATRVLYEIPDPSVWAHIESHDWGPVSPRMSPLEAHYEDDVLVLDEWRWDDIAFVPAGAFPNAGVRSTCIGDPRLCGFQADKPCGFSRAVAAALVDSPGSRPLDGREPRQDVGAYSPDEGKQGSREKTRGHPETGVTQKKPKEVACMTCEHEKVIAELTDQNKKLDTQAKDLTTKTTELTEKNTKLEAELKDLKAKPPAPVAASDAMVAVQAELKAIKAEYEALKTWKVAAEDADHMHRVQDVVDLQASNGLLDAKKVQAAIESLKKLPNDALDAMKAQLEGVKGKFDSLPSGPKARLIPSVAARFDPMQPTVGDLVGKKPGEK